MPTASPPRSATNTSRPAARRASNIARNPAFTLSDPTVRARYQRKYEETAGLYYAGQVPFAAILARIAEHIARL